jgi:SAM-dependent methyltransferase
MAISATHYAILKSLKNRGILPQGGRILEIGEANYYGDFDPAVVFSDAGESCDPTDLFAVAKLIYKAIFEPQQIISIDMHGENALKHDLNQPISFTNDPVDVVYNHGTAEHVFNIAQVFATMHDACAVGGLLIHESPFTGWVDHGFYCLQPTLFWDLAVANHYKIEFIATEHLSSRTWHQLKSREELLLLKHRDQLADNLMLFVVMRKTVDAPFVVPMQGIYSGTLSDNAKVAWNSLR